MKTVRILHFAYNNRMYVGIQDDVYSGPDLGGRRWGSITFLDVFLRIHQHSLRRISHEMGVNFYIFPGRSKVKIPEALCVLTKNL